jgi:ubiquinone biosynthesis protein UbiJ
VALLPDPASLLATQLTGVLNHLLRGQPWLRERLLPFASRTAALEAGPAKLRVSVEADGQLAPSAGEAPAEVTVHIPLATALALAAGDERARSRIELSGDPAFAAVLGGVLRELRWDAEEDLSRVVGDIAAHRIVQTGRSLLEWQRRTAYNLLETVGEYLTEEKPVLTRREELERWMQEVDLVREATERLEKRIAQLDSRSS